MAAKPESPQRGLEGQQLVTWLFRVWTWITQVWSVATGGTGLSTVAQGDLLYGSATDTLSRLAKDANATRYLANTGASNNPAWAQVNLANGVTGDLPFSNLTQGSALSVVGVTGNATADNASIAAGSDHQVLRRSGTAVAFGAVDLSQAAAVTGDLALSNLAQGTALSVLGVTGNATADEASIVAGTDHQVLRRSGTAVAFGAVNLAQAAAVTGVLPAANGGAEAWAAFTVTRTGWTDVGSPTVTGRYCTVGNVVFFQVKVVPGTTVASVAGTSYFALPVAAGGSSFGGDGSMVDLTTFINVGNAVIDAANSRCYTPTQTATGDTLEICGWFEK